jgi:transcriptional regulator with XRE-family HTH domain
LTKSVFTPTYARFRELLIEAREERGLTQAGLAERLKRPQSYGSKFERGERRLDVVEYLERANALRIDPLRLLRNLASATPKRATPSSEIDDTNDALGTLTLVLALGLGRALIA